MLDPRTIGIAKFGQNPDVDAAAIEDIWSYGGTYTFLSVATQLYASSSAAGDTTQTFEVLGLDGAGLEVIRTVTLNGRTQVALSDTLLAVIRAYNSGSVAATGDVYIAEADDLTDGVPDTASKVKAKIDIAAQQTLMAITTIPVTVGTKTVRRAWITDMLATVLPGSPSGVVVNLALTVQLPGGVFRVRSTASLTDSQPILYRPFPKYIEVTPLSRVKMTAETDTNNTLVSGEFAIFYEIE